MHLHDLLVAILCGKIIFAHMTDFSNDVEQCLQVLQRGGIILYPTDTIWGLGCDATNEAAVEKIYQIKKRPASKSMIVLLADERDVLKYVAGLDLQLFDYLEQTEKPTTVIYDGAIGLAENLLGDDGSIGIRIVKETFCKHLIKRFRKPLVSTSANISGEASPENFSAISTVIKEQVDYIVEYRRDDNVRAKPSSVIRWKDGRVEVLRD
jgi:L-threonylcarbamoyladenylate synthase